MSQETNLQPYDPETLGHFRTMLLAERVRIMARLQRNSDPIFLEELNSFEPKDRLPVAVQHDSEGAAIKTDLVDVETALRKIEDGTYGLCEACGKRILLARLEAFPTAKRCVFCQAEKMKIQNRLSRPRVSRSRY